MDGNAVLAFVADMAWPVLVASVLIWLRKPLKARLRDLVKVRGAGVELELVRAGADLKREVREAGEALAEQAPTAWKQGPPAAIAGRDEPYVGPPEEPVSPNARVAIEDLVRAAARWGHRRGLAGYSDAEPAIRWDDNGAPEVDLPPVTDRKSRASVSAPLSGRGQNSEYVANLEARVKELEAEVAAVKADPMMALANHKEFRGLELQLRQARERLAAVLPTSGLL